MRTARRYDNEERRYSGSNFKKFQIQVALSALIFDGFLIWKQFWKAQWMANTAAQFTFV